MWKATLEKARNLITIQGEVLYSANLLQDAFYELFSIATGLERPDEFGAEVRFHSHALAMWHVVLNDGQQRDMAITAISTVPTKLNVSKAIHRLEWAKQQLESLVPYRNLAAHTPIMFRRSITEPGFPSFPAFGAHGTRLDRKRRLAAIRDLRFWHSIRDDFLSLRDYVAAVNDQIRRIECESRGAKLINVPHSWPARPRLKAGRKIAALNRLCSPPQAQKASRAAKRRTRLKSSAASPGRAPP